MELLLYKEILGKNLKACRELSGLTQSAVVELTSIETAQVLSQYENGNRIPKLPILCELADLYHVSLDSLFDREKNPTVLMKDFENIGLNTQLLGAAYNFPVFADFLNWLIENQNEPVFSEFIRAAREIEKYVDSQALPKDDFIAYKSMLLGNLVSKSMFRFFVKGGNENGK